MQKTSVHIYTPLQTARLEYTLQWIFGEQLSCTYIIHNDVEQWQQAEGIKINYSEQLLSHDSLWIRPQGLLGEQDIRSKHLSVHRWKHSTILFYNQPGAAMPFDIFAAVFYLISRYEEYLPGKRDVHGRYRHEDSAAGRYAFLHQPVVDQWLQSFQKLLIQQHGFNGTFQHFEWLPTYDIDIAWSYLHKSRKRLMGAFLKNLLQLQFGRIRERKAVLSGRIADPYDSFERLSALHQRYQVQPLYFFLLGENTPYDKNIHPRHPAMQQLMRQLAGRGETGIHPSYAAQDDPGRIGHEINILSEALQQPVMNSRQHYIRFTLPETYRALMACNIRNEYSMGYAGSNGFRAGTSRSFLWYDLQRETATTLRVHPFAFMEMTSKFYLRQSPDAAYLEWERLYEAVKNVNGRMISIWHNHSLGTDKNFAGWWELYEKMWAMHYRE